MPASENYEIDLGSIDSTNFDRHALELFRFQSRNNLVYLRYLRELGVDPSSVQDVEDIPFLPIDFFKHHEVKTGDWEAEATFVSSGTTGMTRSRHEIRSLTSYRESIGIGFEQAFGAIDGFRIVAIRPAHVHGDGSSLITMLDFLVSEGADGSCFVDVDDRLLQRLLDSEGAPLMIWGVTYSLLNLARSGKLNLAGCTVVETGGMKGLEKELIRPELLSLLEEGLGRPTIYSEYGMTELISQAYGLQGKLQPARTMRLLVREVNDPFCHVEDGRTGGMNIIDLANVHSCGFIETQDLGRRLDSGEYEILGRFDNSDLRGCNLLSL